MQLVTMKQACSQIGVSRTKLWKMVKDGEFPKPINISGQRKGFVDAEIQEWVESRIKERDQVSA